MWPINSRKGSSGFSWSSTAEEVTQGIDGTGLIAIVTGSNSGIGKETTRVLALRGVHVIMAVRNINGGREVKEEILSEITSAKLDLMELDLSSFSSIRKFASNYISSGLHLNILIICKESNNKNLGRPLQTIADIITILELEIIHQKGNNAGVTGNPFMLSIDNVELQFATNYLGHFLLTNLLLDTMKRTSLESGIEGRIVNLSSGFHKFATFFGGIGFNTINNSLLYTSSTAYAQSKLANVLHANELARRLKEDGSSITANSLHPGIILTGILRHSNCIAKGIVKVLCRFALKSVQQGAATTCYVSLHPQVKGLSGEYFVDSNISQSSSIARDMDLANKLWDFSLSLTT